MSKSVCSWMAAAALATVTLVSAAAESPQARSGRACAPGHLRQFELQSQDQQIRYEGEDLVWISAQGRPRLLPAGDWSFRVDGGPGGQVSYEPNSGFLGDLYVVHIATDGTRTRIGHAFLQDWCQPAGA